MKAKRTKKKPYTVLSVDGGGLRGAIPAAVLEGLEDYIKKYIKDDLCLGHKKLDLEVYTVVANCRATADPKLTTEGPHREAWFRCASSHACCSRWCTACELAALRSKVAQAIKSAALSFKMYKRLRGPPNHQLPSKCMQGCIA